MTTPHLTCLQRQQYLGLPVDHFLGLWDNMLLVSDFEQKNNKQAETLIWHDLASFLAESERNSAEHERKSAGNERTFAGYSALFGEMGVIFARKGKIQKQVPTEDLDMSNSFLRTLPQASGAGRFPHNEPAHLSLTSAPGSILLGLFEAPHFL